MLRALWRYLRQIGISYSQRYIAKVLVKQPDAATALVALFNALHDPNFTGARERASEVAGRSLRGRSTDGLARRGHDRPPVSQPGRCEPSHQCVSARRGEFAEAGAGDQVRQRRGRGLVAPRPYREISVYSPRVEGVHLRFGPIARGGIRWSDRPEDFRTEVLGLVKAQQVKNAVIVPVGAKGGFVPKLVPKGAAASRSRPRVSPATRSSSARCSM